MRRTVVLDVVGLTPSLVGEHTPNLKAFASRGATRALREVLPAVTCTAHATFTTGSFPRDHGIVANAFYDPATGTSFSGGSRADVADGRW